MWKENLKLTLREMRKNKFYSLINVFGLAVGMASSVLILLWVQHELSYDRMHQEADRIYRATVRLTPPGQDVVHTALSPIPLAPVLEARVPEVTESVRMVSYFEGALPGEANVSLEEELENFRERFFWVDDSFFELFSFPLLEGDPEHALTEPNSVVLTETVARKFFGGDDALGRTITLDTGFSREQYKVTGVVEDPPENSHLDFDVLVSFVSMEHVRSDERVALENWDALESYTYLRLPERLDEEALEDRLIGTVEEHLGTSLRHRVSVQLQPLTDIHLHSHLLNEMSVNGDVAYVYTFSVVAAFLLLIACVNYMNLATARSAMRAREVAMRKVLGARRIDLIRQFLGESSLYALLAFVFALALVWFLRPVLGTFLSADLSIAPLRLLGLLAIVLLVALGAGAYPAFFLSSFQPRKVLSGDLTTGAGGRRLRTALVSFQFVFSAVLIISTMVVFDQTEHMRSYRLGFDEEQIVMVPVRDITLRERYVTVKNELEQVPDVVGSALSAIPLGNEAPQIGCNVEGREERFMIGSLVVDHGFLDVFDHELIAGRNFSPSRESDLTSAFLANEATLRLLGLSADEAVGKAISWGNLKKGRIIGVIRDFHYEPLTNPVKPLLLHPRPKAFHYLWIRLAPENLTDAMDRLGDAWARLFPDQPFAYRFVDQEMDRLYRADERLGRAFGLFAGIAVFVACLGLLGMISFVAEQRTQEIGVRKVMGAKVRDIVLLLTWQFTKVVLVSVGVAIPIAWLAMSEWLEGYAYRIDLGPGVFLIGGLAVLLIAWTTVALQAALAARLDPVATLQYE